MKITKLRTHQLLVLTGCDRLLTLVAALALPYLPSQSRGQGNDDHTF